MAYRLVQLRGRGKGRVHDLPEHAALVLGRDPALAQILFEADERVVSRAHASVQAQGGMLLLRDLESTTGTFVDGESIEEAELSPGDEFELGPGGPRVRFEEADAARAERDTLASASPGARLRLVVVTGPRPGEAREPGGSVVRLGRATTNALAFPEVAIVSAQHAKILRLDEGFVLMDLESTNGTFLNGQRTARARLSAGDRITLGPGGPEVRVEIVEPLRTAEGATVVIPHFAEIKDRRAGATLVEEVPLPEGGLVVGRGERADIRLSSPMISKTHARLRRDGDAVALEDLGSTNGTYVGGERVSRRVLARGERATVGPFQLEIADGRVRVFDTRRRTEIAAQHARVAIDGRPILDDVSVTLPPGSFTAVIGPSGSGKSTLLQVLNGARSATTGRVLVNGADLAATAGALKGTIGYVPQDDIVHAELTPHECLDYTARLRLPPDTTAEERTRRVADVLHTLELTERAHVEIGRLSGGQRKRVSIAVELLTEPDVLYLDEPASGLDPGLEEALMLLLRELSFKGKTIVVVTHTLDHIHLCDKIVLLLDGRVGFDGPPEDARRRFGVAHLTQLYTRLKEKTAAEWTAAAAAPEPVPVPATSPALPAPGRETRPAVLRQLVVLASRYWRTATRDRRNALLLVGQAPLVAVLIGLSLLYGAGDAAYTKPKNTLLFLLALTAVWFGCSNAARELVKERAVFLRERMVGLRVVPYVLSKLVVLSGLALVQCLAFLLILDLWLGIPGQKILLLAAMMLAATLGLLLGLLISAAARTADRAMTLLPIVLIPQVLFTFPAVQLDMKGPAGIIARGMPTWWAYDLMRRIALAPDATAPDEVVEARLAAGGPVLLTRARFESMLGEGFPMWSYRNAAEITWTAEAPARWGEAALPARLGYWRPVIVDGAVLAGMAAALLGLVVRRQRRQDAYR